MLDPSCETGETWTGSAGTGFVYDKGRPPAGPGLRRCFLPVPRKSTVKELLMMQRQKLNCFQDDNAINNNFQSDLFSDPIRQPGPPTPPAPVTLFQWQLEQEEQRVAGMSAELLSAQDTDGDTILHIAVAQGKRALAYVLAPKMAERGVLDLKEHNGQTALQIAVAANNHLIVQDLVAHGAAVNTRDLWGRSPLHVCAQKGHDLSLQAIWRSAQATRQELDPEMFNYEGLTSLHVASVSHNAAVKELRDLKNPCAFRKTELERRRQTHAAVVKTLLLMGASAGTRDLKSGRTSLHVASEEANAELLQILLHRPSGLAAVNATMFNGNTALHVVSSLQNARGQAAAAKLLMRRGADPSIRNLEGELPSQLAPGGPAGEKVRQVLKRRWFQA